MNKKAFMGDGLFNITYLFIIGIFLVAMWILISNINTAWNSNPDLPDVSKNIFSKYSNNFVRINDSMFLLITIGFIIALVVTAILVKSHPVFAVVGIIIMIVFVAVSIYLSNAYRSFVSNSEIGVYAADFTMLNSIINNLPKFSLFMLVVFLIILFAKSKQGSGSL